MPVMPDRLPLAQLPTPLERADRLSAAWGGPTIWVKRDDLSGFGLSGNKVRKLEYHLAAAQRLGHTSVITCGAVQSNHCRATALASAKLGLRCILLLRSPDGAPPPRLAGNHLLDSLAGAEIRFITPSQYRERDAMMAHIAAEESGGYVIPEGASDALGMWGFVTAMRELDDQAARIPGMRYTVWHAASSGGTTAGLGWAADRLGRSTSIIACSVGDPAAELRRRVETIWDEALAEWGGSVPAPNIEFTDTYVGGGYGAVTDEELAIQAEATALTGLLFDPTYTGKVLYGLEREIARGRFGADDHVVFWHTGGGFAVFAADYGAALASLSR